MDSDNKPIVPITVVIPSFNSSRFIDLAIASIVSGSVLPWEIIVVDAGSSDHTRELIEELRSQINIRFIESPGAPIGTSRNIGIRQVSSEFVAFLDSDDFFMPHKLERAFAAFEEDPTLDLVAGKSCQWDARRDTFHLNYDYSITNSFLIEIFNHGLFNLSSLVVRKSFLERKDVWFNELSCSSTGEDWDFVAQLIVNRAKIHFCDEIVSIVTQRPFSHTHPSIEWKLKLCTLRTLERSYSVVQADHMASSRDMARIDRYLAKFRIKAILVMLGCGRQRPALIICRHQKGLAWRSLSYLLVVASMIVSDFRAVVDWVSKVRQRAIHLPQSLELEGELAALVDSMRARIIDQGFSQDPVSGP